MFVRWGLSASLGEGIMNELLRHQNLCSLWYLLVVNVGNGMGDCLGGEFSALVDLSEEYLYLL